MNISLDSRMHVYRALVKTMNSCTCPIVKDMLLDELFRQYRLMAIQMEPKWMEFQGKMAAIRRLNEAPFMQGFCSASDVGG